MKEKILVLLTAKFAGVRKDGLARLAGALALNATTEEEAGELVEKLTPEKVTEFVTDYRKDVDTEVSTANKTHEGNLKKKYEFVEKEEGGSGKKPKTKTNEGDDDDIDAKLEAALEKRLKPLQEKLAAYEGKQTTESRLQTLEGKLKDVPEAFKQKAMKDFKRMNFESDDAFNEYLTEMDTDVTALNQELADKGFGAQSKPFFGKPGASEEDAFVDSMAAINKTEEK